MAKLPPRGKMPPSDGYDNADEVRVVIGPMRVYARGSEMATFTAAYLMLLKEKGFLFDDLLAALRPLLRKVTILGLDPEPVAGAETRRQEIRSQKVIITGPGPNPWQVKMYTSPWTLAVILAALAHGHSLPIAPRARVTVVAQTKTGAPGGVAVTSTVSAVAEAPVALAMVNFPGWQEIVERLAALAVVAGGDEHVKRLHCGTTAYEYHIDKKVILQVRADGGTQTFKCTETVHSKAVPFLFDIASQLQVPEEQMKCMFPPRKLS